MEANTEQIALRTVLEIDAANVPYRELNTRLRNAVAGGTQKMIVRSVHGQRYVGTNLGRPVEVEIHGTPGNELGAFMDGPQIIVRGNVPDDCGNAMNNGEIVIHGHAGHNLGLSARGGKIFVRDGVGRRAGSHMKAFKEQKPLMVIGGTAEDDLGEYLAGGTLIVLGLTQKEDQPHGTRTIGNGMHGGVIYIRGTVEDCQLSKEIGRIELDQNDLLELQQHVKEFAGHFGHDVDEIMRVKFTKLLPLHIRTNGRVYAY